MLYLATLNGEILPQTLPTIRNHISYPFQVECVKSAGLDQILPGTKIKVIGFTLGKYTTDDGKRISGTDQSWRLLG